MMLRDDAVVDGLTPKRACADPPANATLDGPKAASNGSQAHCSGQRL